MKVSAKYGGQHPGFKAVQSSIAAKQGVPKERAGAILAAATRRASPAAKKANPNLKKVKTDGSGTERGVTGVEPSDGRQMFDGTAACTCPHVHEDRMRKV